jgi:hypothetical protein
VKEACSLSLFPLRRGPKKNNQKDIVMELKLDYRLQHASHKHLYLLLREMIERHPALLDEIVTLLKELEETKELTAPLEVGNLRDLQSSRYETPELDEDEEVTEDWDFNGDEIVAFRPPSQPTLLPLDIDAYRLRIDAYGERLNQGASSQAIFDDLTELLEEAETRAEHHDYHNALHLYALVLDERLGERSSALTLIFDKAIDEIMPILETLLSEVSSNVSFDPSIVLSPLLTIAVRRSWLERLFALWLKHLDARRLDESIPELLLNVAWSEDLPLLHALIQQEFQHHPRLGPSNIVDLSRQYRIRALEKFLKELPPA